MTTPEPSAAPMARPVLLGHQAVAALWLPHEWFDEAARRRRIVQAWRPGCTALRFADGDLLRFASELVDDCEALPGWPLRRVAGVLCSAEIDPADLAGRAHADVLLAQGGAWRGLQLVEAQPLDPSTWIDVGLGLVDTFDCRLPAVERRLVEPVARELREVLGDSVPGAPTAETRSFLAALAARGKRNGPQAPGAAPRHPHPGFQTDSRGGAAKIAAVLAAVVLVGGIAALLFGDPESGQGSGGHLPSSVFYALGFLVFYLMRFGAGRGKPGAGAAAPARQAASAAPAGAGSRRRAGEGALARAKRALRTLPARASAKVMPQRWRQWAARLAMTTGLSSLLGAQHSAYMQRMLKMFDDGRLDNALRHAIPLGGDNPSLGQAFGRLGPRDALQLREQRGPATSIGLGDDLEKHLRALYRRTFDQLDRAGRIDEAVFVLAELLNARQEALDYLEKHQRFAQAAELALAWDMPAAQIVRLHALAGDWRVAVLVARRDDAFEAALALLEPRWPEAGLQLRHEWAQSLVARGRWLDAVRVAWKVDTERAAAAEWLQVAEAAGGAPAARALAWRAQCLPDTLSSQSERIAALRDDPALLHERAALAHELLRLPVPVTAAARRLAAATAGALIVDQAEARAPLAVDDKNRFDPKALRRLVELAADPALSADLPTTGWPERARRPLTQHATPLEWTAPEAGLHAIVDAVPLPDGEFLLALGEAGAVRVDAQGRWRARFAAPAQQIVIANDGHGALVLARRERVWRVSRLELARGQVVDLGMHELDAFATRFDGIGWSVATGRRVQVLDTTRGLREALWQVADLPGAVLALDATASQEIWVLRGDSGLAQWIYALPSRRLQSRDPLPDEADHAVARALVAGVGLVEFSAHPTQPGLAQVRSFTQPAQRWVDVPWHGPGTLLCAAGHWLALREPLADDATDITIALVHGQTGRVHARWHWPRDARLKVRAFDDQWLLFDDQGRLAAVDVEDGVPRELSLR